MISPDTMARRRNADFTPARVLFFGAYAILSLAKASR